VVKKKKAGWGSSAGAKPLSVEELLRKKREADAAASKVSLFLCFTYYVLNR
jgi:ATP-dependent RNA helicase DDX23/PRP28